MVVTEGIILILLQKSKKLLVIRVLKYVAEVLSRSCPSLDRSHHSIGQRVEK